MVRMDSLHDYVLCRVRLRAGFRVDLARACSAPGTTRLCPNVEIFLIPESFAPFFFFCLLFFFYPGLSCVIPPSTVNTDGGDKRWVVWGRDLCARGGRESVG
ncbi:hypothetical protein K505DRAFT_96426 [Melanomma pulvis-pyrius CBS 109.77]|uniref:Uncharacterized protein n=1 Tax=Melanomma pulvis-pyrius CBS 109.77 TaxID=1314802 RepID=A0A6A6X019_9PLEO|nr:hypothetical protein K505DRAFT_96426 [Melanomma pulvis-pyrius CBS 109.77]